MISLWKYILALLVLVNTAICLTIITFPSPKFRLIACDVGQGDAILATLGNFQILTDGGVPNGKVIDCLSRYMPFWDRKIEVIVNTHPQLDHYGGLIEVMQKYKVSYFLGNNLDSDTSEYRVLKDLVGSRGIKVVIPKHGTTVRYSLIRYDVFFPTNEFLTANSVQKTLASGAKEDTRFASNSSQVLGLLTTKRDPNDFSIQAVLSYGNFDALLTGDIGHNMAREVMAAFKSKGFSDNSKLASNNIEYLKIPHHGSKYGIAKDYLDIINPMLAVISVGSKNTYGHPTQEILKLLNDNKINIYRTDIDGDIVVETDGINFEVYKNK